MKAVCRDEKLDHFLSLTPNSTKLPYYSISHEHRLSLKLHTLRQGISWSYKSQQQLYLAISIAYYGTDTFIELNTFVSSDQRNLRTESVQG